MSNKKLIKIGKPKSFKILEKIDDIIKLQQMKEALGRTANPKKNKISLKNVVFEMHEEMRNGFAQINKRLDNMDRRLNIVENTIIDVIKTNNLKTSQNNQNT